MDHIFFIHSSAEGHLGSFHSLAIAWLLQTGKETMNVGEVVEKVEPSYTVGGNAS